MPREKSASCKWEKDRRDRLNVAFTQLSKVLPNYNPSVSLSKIDILQTATSSIQDLDERIKNILQSKTSNCKNKEKAEIIKQLQDRTKKLLRCNEQLCSLLKNAGIRIPADCDIPRKLKKTPLSNKFTPEQAKKIQKKELNKENLLTNKVSHKKPRVTIASKHKLVVLNPQVKKVTQRRRKNRNNVPASNCLIFFSQPTNVNPYYILSNVTSNNIQKRTANSTVLTNSTFFTTPLVSSSIKPTVIPASPLVSTLGPGTIILANGTCLPIVKPPQASITTPTLISSQTPNPALIIVSKCADVQTTHSVSSSRSTTSKKVASVNFTNNLPLLKPKTCLTRTTQINKLPIPALTSRYNNYVLVKKQNVPSSKPVGNGPMKNVISGVKRKSILKGGNGVTKKSKANNVLQKKCRLNPNNEEDRVLNQNPALEGNLIKTPETATIKGIESVSSVASNDKASNVLETCDTVSLELENKSETCDKQKTENETNTNNIDNLSVITNVPATGNAKHNQKSQIFFDHAISEESTTKVSENTCSSVTITTSAMTSITSSIETSENQVLKTLELNLSHSELSNDIFASLQVPPGCQNPESTSPTAAFLLAFPLVSSGAKVTEVIGEENSESQRATPNLLRIEAIDGTIKNDSVQHSSDNLTPNLLGLENFPFFDEKSNKDICNGFYGTAYINTSSTNTVSVTTNIDTINSSTKTIPVNSSTKIINTTNNETDVKLKIKNQLPEPTTTKMGSNVECNIVTQNNPTSEKKPLAHDNYTKDKTQTLNVKSIKPNFVFDSFEQNQKNYSLIGYENKNLFENSKSIEENLKHTQESYILPNVSDGSININSTKLQSTNPQTYELSCRYNDYQNQEKPIQNLAKQASYNAIPNSQQFSNIDFVANKIENQLHSSSNNHENLPKKNEQQSNLSYHSNNFTNDANCSNATQKSFSENMECIKYQEMTKSGKKLNQQKSGQIEQQQVLQNYQFASNSSYHNVGRVQQNNETKQDHCQKYISFDKTSYKEDNKNSSNIEKCGVDQKNTSNSVGYSCLANTKKVHSQDSNKSESDKIQQNLFSSLNYHQTPEQTIYNINGVPNYQIPSNQNKANDNKQQNGNFVTNRCLNESSSAQSLESTNYQRSNQEYVDKNKLGQNIDSDKNFCGNTSNEDGLTNARSGRSHISQSFYTENLNKPSVTTANTIDNKHSHMAQNYQISSELPNYQNTAIATKNSKDANRNAIPLQTYPNIHCNPNKSSSQGYSYNKKELGQNKESFYTATPNSEKVAISSYGMLSGEKNCTSLSTASNNNYNVPNYHTDFGGFNQQYYKSNNNNSNTTSTPHIEHNKNYYALNYENYAGYHKRESSSNNRYCTDTSTYTNNKDKYNIFSNSNTSYSKTSNNTSKPSTSQNKPVNWMTTPSNNTSSFKHDYLLPSFCKGSEVGHNIHTNNANSINFVSSSTYFNSASSRYTTSEMTPSEINHKKSYSTIDLPVLQQQRDVDDNQFSWSPSKLPHFLETAPQIVSSTLPTLVGDLALNTVTPYIEPKATTTKTNVKKVANNNYDNTQQTNFLSVSQLVDHNIKEPTQRTTNRRNSTSRSKYSAVSKSKRLHNNGGKQEAKDHVSGALSKNSESKNQPQVLNKPPVSSYNLSENIFCDQKSTSRSVAIGKNVPSSYSAEALIGSQGNNETSASNNKKPSISSTTSKSIVPNFLAENIISYYPPVDIASDPNYIQQNHQNYQGNTFSHTNFGTSFPNNPVYSSTNFIPSVSTITTTYLPSSNFMQHDVSIPEFIPDGLNIFNNNCTTAVTKDKSFKTSNNYNRANPKDENSKALIIANNTNSGGSNVKKSSSKKRATATTTNDGVLPNFDFPFLTVPGAINSPILPDDFHTHTSFFPPPTAPYACKTPLYPKQNPDLGATTLLSHPLPPPVPPSRSTGIQHHVSDITPCINALGGSSSLTNFNLSTIFPEINKGPIPDVFPTEALKVKDTAGVKNFSSTSSKQVPFNSKPTFSFSTYNS